MFEDDVESARNLKFIFVYFWTTYGFEDKF
jgi:hypothetical protein